ncbi:nicotinamidase [Microvirga lenta]|uniref:nicotinamidase n=1 Tax=Microvirga lenta TaxID=2881337 RepID=UPI001CFF7ECA|nr:nicotinamidase [Microvirga lenta]MCB5177384.1 nicotinamidase [Microvirga lenta]
MISETTLTPTETDILIVTDVQYDFLPGGALAVPDGDAVIAPINRLAQAFRHVLPTQDWHPPGHTSFASSHPGRTPFEVIELDYGPQVLWPDHCIQATPGAEISRDLHIPHAQLVIRKGYDPKIDSYSGFIEADRKTSTGLAGYLKERGFRRVFCTGLALDFCVHWTALDAKAAGFDTYVIEDASRAIDTNGSLARARDDLRTAEVHTIRSSQIVTV